MTVCYDKSYNDLNFNCYAFFKISVFQYLFLLLLKRSKDTPDVTHVKTLIYRWR